MIPAEDGRAELITLSDETYSRICYHGAPVSIASFPGIREKTIILDGFSKTYAMTGWRIGYGVMPEWLVEAVNKLMVNSNSCTASFTQRTAAAAMTGPQEDVDRMVAEVRRRRDPFCDAGATDACIVLAFESVDAYADDSKRAGDRCQVAQGTRSAAPSFHGAGSPGIAGSLRL